MSDSSVKNNVVSINNPKIPPKTFKVRHKGLHGTVTYDPIKKVWTWVTHLHIPMAQKGEEDTQEKATLALKRILDTAATGRNVTTTD